MGITTFTQTHNITTCGVCGIQFTVPEFLHDTRSKTGSYVWCPNGHQLTIPQEDEVVRLKRQVSSLNVEIEDKARSIDNLVKGSRDDEKEIARLLRRINSLKGRNTTLKNKWIKVNELLKSAEDKVFKQVKDGLQE